MYHESFRRPDAGRVYGTDPKPGDDALVCPAYMPDEVTRDLARRMHYAAWRWRRSAAARAGRWQARYYALRDRIILGNRKLVFRTVHRKMPGSHLADDLVGDCDVVLIRAAASYNPWLGVRFSTYAVTCLARALARARRRLAADPLVHATATPDLADYLAGDGPANEPSSPTDPWRPLLGYLSEDDPLLTEREKAVLERRYRLAGRGETATLEELGRDLGISRERVRQIQVSAVGKLRQALLGDGQPAPA